MKRNRQVYVLDMQPMHTGFLRSELLLLVSKPHTAHGIRTRVALLGSGGSMNVWFVKCIWAWRCLALAAQGAAPHGRPLVGWEVRDTSLVGTCQEYWQLRVLLPRVGSLVEPLVSAAAMLGLGMNDAALEIGAQVAQVHNAALGRGGWGARYIAEEMDGRRQVSKFQGAPVNTYLLWATYLKYVLNPWDKARRTRPSMGVHHAGDGGAQSKRCLRFAVLPGVA
eukprot:scaffold12859_cov22-Tisochrysis_lutea.AAC.1